MAKGLTIVSIVVALLILLLFALDLATGIPFRRASKSMDIVFVICALGLGYISWSAMKDLR